jgi:hypothetical protein
MTDKNIMTLMQMLYSFEPQFTGHKKCNIITTVYDKIDYIQFFYHYIIKHFHKILDESSTSTLQTPSGIIQLYTKMYHKSFDFIPQIIETKFTIQKSTIQTFLNTLIEFRRKYETYRYNQWGKYIAYQYAHFDLYLLNHIESFL